MTTQRFQDLEPLEPGVTLVEASAGTGKTYTIASLVLRLVAEEGIPIERVLVVTFTEAATAELQDRIRSRLRDALLAIDALPETPKDPVFSALLAARDVVGERDTWSDDARAFVDKARRRLALAVTSFDRAAISTIHGFCQRTLRENAFESGIVFDTELVGDPAELLGEAVADFWVNKQHAGDRAFLRFVESKNITPEKMVRLARTALADPQMPVTPPSTGAADTTDFTRFAALYDEARELWGSERDHIVQILAQAAQAGRIRKGSYRADQLEARVVEVGAFFSGDAFQLAKLPKKLEFFRLEKIRSSTNRGQVTPSHPFFDLVDGLYDAWERIVGSLEDRLVAFRRELVDWVREEVPRRKRAAQVQSFDDLLNVLDRALAGPGGDDLARAVRSAYDVALIDEFQDTDPVQYRIFSHVFGGRESVERGGRLFLIGDPKQAIYAFRGADIFAYIRAAQEAERRRTLGTNYRSGARLIGAVNTLFSRPPNPFGLSEISFQPVDAPPKPTAPQLFVRGMEPEPLTVFMRNRTIEGAFGPTGRPERFPPVPKCVAASVVQLLRSDAEFRWTETVDGEALERTRPVAPGDIAVLVRTNFQGNDIQRALQAAGVPSVVQDGTSVFASPDAGDMLHLLRALVEPNRMPTVRAALITDFIGLTGDDLLRLDDDPDEWDTVIDLFREWRDLWRRRGFIHAFRAVLAQRLRLRDPDKPESPPAQLLRRTDGERRMTNLLHIAELMHEVETRERMSPAGLVRWLSARRVDHGDRDASQLRMESDAAAVKITTIHKSKGLEFPIVYCPYLCSPVKLGDTTVDGLSYHDADDDRRLKLALSPDDAVEAQALEETFGESMRLLYVALTRAKSRCVFFWDLGPRAHEQSALAWLLFAKAGDTRESLAERLSGMEPAAHWGELRALANASEGTIRSAMLRPDVDIRLPRAGDDDVPLEVRRTARELQPSWRISSYSALVAGGADAGPVAEGHDHADTAALVEPDLGPKQRGDTVTMADVPAGARFGRMIHEIYEHIDFCDADGPEGAELVSKVLGIHGFEPELADVVHRGVLETLDTPLSKGGPRLADIPRAARLDELGFLFPVRSRAKVQRERLAAAFEAHGGPRLAPVAEAVANLAFEPFEGFLTGFIDLAFVHKDRWYVLDYKSNDLGPTRDRYARGALDRAMLHGMYHLQYHLYAVALRRYLKWRVPGWNYENHFGGAYYLFVRGMHPDAGPEYGVFHDKPNLALIRAIDQVLDEGPAAGRDARSER